MYTECRDVIDGSREITRKGDLANTTFGDYEHYQSLGGIINEEEYQSAIDRTTGTKRLDRRNPYIISCIAQARAMASYAGILLGRDTLDPRVRMYVLLRSDALPKGLVYHHSQMSDQRIFGEVFRMFDDTIALGKLIDAYPKISFVYQ